ncbi:MAG: hypothetical protein ACREC0_14565 [Methylocella sp.]
MTSILRYSRHFDNCTIIERSDLGKSARQVFQGRDRGGIDDGLKRQLLGAWAMVRTSSAANMISAKRPRLEHVPKKLLGFFDSGMLQLFDFELCPYRSNDSI